LAEPVIDTRCLTRADMIAVIRRLIKVQSGLIAKDDIDHLGNRRVRSVGELLQNQFRVGLLRLERVVRERMTVQDIETVTPQALINIRPVVPRSRSSRLLAALAVHGPDQLAGRTHA